MYCYVTRKKGTELPIEASIVNLTYINARFNAKAVHKMKFNDGAVK